MTIYAAGIYDAFIKKKDIKVINVDEQGVPWEVLLERRREAPLADFFISGTNAVTEAGQLMNLDVVGNRVSGIIFGPKNVVILIWRNKIVSDLNAAMDRIKKNTAPVNSNVLILKLHVLLPDTMRIVKVRSVYVIPGLLQKNSGKKIGLR
jgi:hypothetical protein